MTPPEVSLGHFTKLYSDSFAGGDVASVIVALSDDEEKIWREVASALIKPALAAGAAFLLSDHLVLVSEFNADGLHVETGIGNVAQLVDTLSPEKIVGAGGLTNRHDAMIAGESGVDYVMFGACNTPGNEAMKFGDVKILTEWWSELVEVPCVAPATTLVEARELAECGADFVSVSALVWDHEEGPAAAVVALNAVFDEIANT